MIIKININKELLWITAKYFGYENHEDYSKLIEQSLKSHLKPHLGANQTSVFEEYLSLTDLQQEPEIDINAIEKNYNFNIHSVEGKWPGKESIEQLMSMLSK